MKEAREVEAVLVVRFAYNGDRSSYIRRLNPV
jgi:hypothetical protein